MHFFSNFFTFNLFTSTYLFILHSLALRMGSQSRRNRKSNRKRDDPIHKVKERQEELCMEEKQRKKNREAQARSRAKKREVSFVEPISPHPPPNPTPPSSSPTPSLHSSPCHSQTNHAFISLLHLAFLNLRIMVLFTRESSTHLMRPHLLYHP